MRTYIIDYAEDMKYIKDKWIVHDKRAKSGVYYGFETKTDALKFAYNILMKKYQSKKDHNIMGLLKLTKMPYDPKKPIEWDIGWHNGYPTYYPNDYWAAGFYRIKSDGSVKLIDF